MAFWNRLYSISTSVAVAAIFGSAAFANDGDRYLAKAAFDHERYDIALSEYTKLATSGDAAAHFALGHMYLNGLGVAPDRERGMELMRQAAEGGHSEAASVICFDLFERATTRADFEEVVQECTPAGIYTGGSKPTELSFDKNYAVKARFRVAVAYDRLGEQYLAFLCYLPTYMAMSDATGVAHSDEGRFIEKRFAVFNLQGHTQGSLGTLTGRQPELNEVVPPCMSRTRAVENWSVVAQITLRGTFR